MLLLGRGWRLELAIRLWGVAVAAWGVAFAAQWGVVPIGLPDPHLLLAPTAAAVAALCGTAVLAVEHDLRFARFGWRQALLPVMVVAAVLATLPSVLLLNDGRWGLVRGDHMASLSFADADADGSYRVLWIASPGFLPVSGRALDDGLAWAVTTDGEVTVVDRFLPVESGRTDLIAQTVDAVAERETSRAGRLLAGVGVRYVVLLNRLAPAPFSTELDAKPVPAVVRNGFGDQLDLQLLEGTNSAVDVFVNTSWVPLRSAFAAGFDSDIAELADLERRPLQGAAAVLSGDATSLSGAIPDGAEVLVTQTPSAGWRFEIGGVPAARQQALGWATVYLPQTGGNATFEYSAPWWRDAAHLVQVLAPLVLAGAWLRRRLGGP